MKKASIFIAAALSCAMAQGAVNTLDIRADRPGADIAPTMYGLFFEDINFGADGGLYAEMVKNRSFEFPDRLMGWRSFGNVDVLDDGPFGRNPHYVRLSSPGHREKRTGLDNEGFFGVSFEEGETYRFSVWARRAGDADSRIIVELIDPAAEADTQVCAKVKIDINNPDWTRYAAELTPGLTVAKGRLRIFLDSEAPADLEHVSLFPADVWKGDAGKGADWKVDDGGLRKDLVEYLAGIKPGVFRFPGGCIVEGTDLNTRYRWKNTVGPVENRPLNENRWHYTFTSRFFPDYYQTGGLGFYEYFLLSEKLGAAPLPVINVGLACQYQNKDPRAHASLDALDPYIQDALDLIEFANGDVSSEWGALRAEMGHPAPFGLKYLAVGNEQWGSEYVDRLKPFVTALRKAHPEIEIVGSSGPSPDGDKFDYLWPEMAKLKVDLVDEHYYKPEDWFLGNATRYDSYDRKAPKVFAGEYACHTDGYKRNNFHAALCEAAFMTGLERNADIVRMATYAPLLAHVEGWQWRPDMIWFDNLRAVPKASYYVQKLYGNYKGDRVLPLSMEGRPVAGLDGQNGLFASAALDKADGTYIVKVANTSEMPQEIDLNIKGMKKGARIGAMKVISLGASDMRADNTLDVPEAVIPKEMMIELPGKEISHSIPAKTFQVLILMPE